MTKTNIIDNINYNVNNPDNIRLYHGGTHFLEKSILDREGFKNSTNTMWDCSDFDMVYFYEFHKFAKSESIEDEDFSHIQYMVLSRANENGQLQEAILNYPGKYTCALEIILPPEAQQFIEEDDSCENMAGYGAVQMDIDIINYFIKTNKCTVNVYRYDFFPKMAYFYYCNQIDNPNAEEYFSTIDKLEYETLKMLSETDTCSIFEHVVLEVDPYFNAFIGPVDPKHYSNN